MKQGVWSYSEADYWRPNGGRGRSDELGHAGRVILAVSPVRHAIKPGRPEYVKPWGQTSPRSPRCKTSRSEELFMPIQVRRLAGQRPPEQKSIGHLR